MPLAERETLPKGTSFRVLGQDVKGVTGIVVGQVVNVLVDEAGQPRAAVLDYGGFLGVGRRRIAVTWPMLRFTPEGIHLSLSRDQLRNFPEYKEGEAVQMALPPARPAPTPPEPTPPEPTPPAPTPPVSVPEAAAPEPDKALESPPAAAPEPSATPDAPPAGRTE